MQSFPRCSSILVLVLFCQLWCGGSALATSSEAVEETMKTRLESVILATPSLEPPSSAEESSATSISLTTPLTPPAPSATATPIPDPSAAPLPSSLIVSTPTLAASSFVAPRASSTTAFPSVPASSSTAVLDGAGSGDEQTSHTSLLLVSPATSSSAFAVTPLTTSAPLLSVSLLTTPSLPQSAGPAVSATPTPQVEPSIQSTVISTDSLLIPYPEATPQSDVGSPAPTPSLLTTILTSSFSLLTSSLAATQSTANSPAPSGESSSGVPSSLVPATTSAMPPSTTVLPLSTPLTTPTAARSATPSYSAPTPASSMVVRGITPSPPPSFSSPAPATPPNSLLNGTNAGPPGVSPAERQFVTLLLLVFGPVVGVLVLSVFIVCCSLCICCCCCGCGKKRRKRHFSDDPSELPMNAMNALSRDNFLYPIPLDIEVKKEEVPISLWMALPWGGVDNLPAGIRSVVKNYSVDRRSLNILATMSRGDFGCIVNGQLSLDRTDPVGGSRGVMMKLLIGFQKQHGHRDEISKFLESATLLRGCSAHPNIHSPMRVSVEDNYVPIIVYPIMEYGNMHQFLTLCRVAPADSPLSPVTVQYKVRFAFQLACGMKHLSDQGIVHSDLALRNCYLDTNYEVKISDSALTQCFHPECYSTVRGTVRPVRWAAIETLQEGLCTSQSNVWSYGVSVWEVMTLGKLPYGEELDNDRGVATHILMDNRLSQPEQCPDDLYSLMLKCWKKRAEDRPNFTVLFSVMSELHGKHCSATAAVPSSVPAVPVPSSTIVNETSYSTFGKDLKPQISVTEVPTGFPNQRRRRSSVVKLSRNNSSISQRDGGGVLAVPDDVSPDQVSLSFSVLSDENFLDQASDSEDDLEGKEIQVSANNDDDEDLATITASSNATEQPPAVELHQTPVPRENYPVESFSTFLPASSSYKLQQGPHQADLAADASFNPAPPQGRRRPSQPSLRAAPGKSPLANRSQCATPIDTSQSSGSKTAANPRPLSDYSGHGILNNSLSPKVQEDVDSISKASTLDSVGTSNSCTKYGGTGENMGGVTLRNKSLLTANHQTNTSAVSGTPSTTSKSDSGIRSDEEADLVLSNGCPPPPAPPMGVSQNRLSSGAARKSLGLGDFSKDIMSTFSSWD